MNLRLPRRWLGERDLASPDQPVGKGLKLTLVECRTVDLATQLLRCPVGCNFLRTIERDQVPVALAATPTQAFARAALALNALNPWSPEFERAMAAALSCGSHLAALASEVAAHPESRWWTDPIDRTRQVFVIEDTSDRTSSPKVWPEWEDYAERPTRWRITSTLRGSYSCVDTVIASGVGDWSETSAYRRLESDVDESARVREIRSPADWHALCVSYPRINRQTDSPAGVGTLVPDWRRVATQWDGVHLTFMALLTVPWVRHTSAAGTTMLWSWNAEGTVWLPGEFMRAGAPLAALGHEVSAYEVAASLRWLESENPGRREA